MRVLTLAAGVGGRLFAFKSVERFVEEGCRFFALAGELEHLGEIGVGRTAPASWAHSRTLEASSVLGGLGGRPTGEYDRRNVTL
jgi:hypothetical protein